MGPIHREKNEGLHRRRVARPSSAFAQGLKDAGILPLPLPATPKHYLQAAAAEPPGISLIPQISGSPKTTQDVGKEGHGEEEETKGEGRERGGREIQGERETETKTEKME